MSAIVVNQSDNEISSIVSEASPTVRTDSGEIAALFIIDDYFSQIAD
jgi:hypothetical protein